MSILHDLPPQTQTSEQIPSGEFTDVSYGHDRLGIEGTRRALAEEDWMPKTEVSIIDFPTHDSVQTGIDFVRTAELDQIAAKLSEINQEIARVDEELNLQNDHLRAVMECIDDLDLANDLNSDSKLFNGYSRVTTLQAIQTLEDEKSRLLEALAHSKKEQSVALAKIERLEKRDFKLLKMGL